MVKVFNAFFSILKIVLLLVSFVFTFYIIMSMYQKMGKSILDGLDIFVPYFLLLLLMFLNYVLGQKQITGNLFYNISSCLVFIVLIVVGYRAMFDEYLLIRYNNTNNIAFSFYTDMLAALKSMIYLLIASNLCLMFAPTVKKVAIKEEAKPQVVEENSTLKKKTRKNVD